MLLGGFIGKIVRFFSKDKVGKDSRPVPSSPAVRTSASKKRKSSRSEFVFKQIRIPELTPIDQTFDLQLSDKVIKEIEQLQCDVGSSQDVMPESLCPRIPDMIQFNPATNLQDFSVEYLPYISEKQPITAIALSKERKHQQQLMCVYYSQQLEQIKRLVNNHKYKAASQLNNELLNSIPSSQQFAEFKLKFEANILIIAKTEEEYRKTEILRKQKEEEERKRREQERIREEKRQYLVERISELRSLATSKKWQEGKQLTQYLLSEISLFGDNTLNQVYAEALKDFEAKYKDYQLEQIRIKEERERIKREEEARAAELQRKRDIDEAKDCLLKFRRAIQHENWSDCLLLNQRLKVLIPKLSQRDLDNEYQSLSESYSTSLREYQKRQQQEREAREKRRQLEEAKRREEQVAREKQLQQERRAAVLKDYIVVTLGYDSQCICLQKYYSVKGYGHSISASAAEFREHIFAFKNKFNDKSSGQIKSARIYFCNKLSILLKALYEPDLSKYYFCTAQASTPESAERRYKHFCEMLCNACGIQNGFDLIQVTGVKASASSGGGTRGDISNLTISSDVAGKRIILLDDIITSGATMAAIRNMLLSKGALSVDCFAFGRTV